MLKHPIKTTVPKKLNFYKVIAWISLVIFYFYFYFSTIMGLIQKVLNERSNTYLISESKREFQWRDCWGKEGLTMRRKMGFLNFGITAQAVNYFNPPPSPTNYCHITTISYPSQFPLTNKMLSCPSSICLQIAIVNLHVSIRRIR